jgi:signal transduction histidine kinase/ligand-binding sensor domain-containing protein
MRNNATFHHISFVIVLCIIAAGCNDRNESIPFPDEMEGPQPVSLPIKFSESKSISNWPATRPLKSVIKKFNLDKLPSNSFDTAGFESFSKQPEEIHFDWDKIPDTVFNYDNLASRPLKFEYSMLEPPQFFKASLHLKNDSIGLVYEMGEPLANSVITALLEDHNGFLWICNGRGLYRYHGENLELFVRLPMPARNMIEDDKGQIWLATNNGIYILNQRAGLLKHITIAGGLADNNNAKILMDKQGRVWTTHGAYDTLSGISVIDENSHTVKQIGAAQGLSSNKVVRIMQDNQNNIWVSTERGVDIINPARGTLRHLNMAAGLISESTNRLLQDDRGRIWIADGSGEMNVIDFNRKSIIHYATAQGLNKGPWVSSLLTHNGKIWIGTNSANNSRTEAIRIIDTERKRIKTVNSAKGISTNDINALLKDKYEQIWIGTWRGLNMVNSRVFENDGKADISCMAEDYLGRLWVAISFAGIQIIDTVTKSIRYFTVANGLSSNTVNSMHEKDGRIWIFGTNGIDIIDPSANTIEHIGKDQGLSGNEVWDETVLFNDAVGRIWIQAKGGEQGIDLLDPVKKTVEHLGSSQGLKNNCGCSFQATIDKHGQVWLASFTGPVNIIDPVKKTIKYLEESSPSDGIQVFQTDWEGNVWIGSATGIHIINNRSDSITTLSVNDGLIDNNVTSLNQHNQRMYVGTRGGITIVTPSFASADKKWKFESFGRRDGIRKLAGSYNSDCITRQGKFLWGDRGITYLDETSKAGPETAITGLDVFNQTQNFFNEPWTLLSETDTIRTRDKNVSYVKGHTPLNVFLPGRGKVRFDSVIGNFNMPANLSVPYYQNYLQFHFAQLHGDNTDTTWYRYILEGASKNWSEKTDLAVSENYLNLPPGNYTFRVSSLYDEKWTTPAEFSFEIRPPWWKTWWAYTLAAFVFITIVIATVQYRSRKLKAEKLALEQKVEQRTSELKRSLQELRTTQAQLIQSEKMASLGELTAGIAHEIQNPLNFVNNFSEVNTELVDELKSELAIGNVQSANEIADNIKDNEQKISHHGKRADSIVKGMLQHSRASSGQKEPTDINALADEYLRLSYHGLRAKDKSFNAKFESNFDPNLEKLNVVPQDIGRVLLNLINNAFYAVTEKKQQLDGSYEPCVSIATRKVEDKVEVKVKDNGNGIPQKALDKIFQPFFTTKPTGAGTGLGLSLSYDIIKAHGGEIKVQTKEGQGSEFIIQLPTSNKG